MHPVDKKWAVSAGVDHADLISLALTYLSLPALTADAPFVAYRLWVANSLQAVILESGSPVARDAEQDLVITTMIKRGW